MSKQGWLVPTLFLAGAIPAAAQEATPASPGNLLAAPRPDDTSLHQGPATAVCKIAAGTVVDLEIAQALSSANQKRGDKFPIRLHRPIMANGMEVMPAGAEGIGEIVHAETARSGGKPGELLLAARYLEQGGSQVRLRALKFGAAGKDNSTLAMGASLALGPLALFIHGRNIEIPIGTLVNAKVAENMALQDCSPDGQSLPDATPESIVPPQTPPSTDPSIQE